MPEEISNEAIETQDNEQVQEDQTSDGTNQTSEDHVEVDAEQVETQPEPQKFDPRQEAWDKQLQKLQQFTATLERQQKAGDSQAAQKTQDRIAELLASEDLDYNPRKGFETFADKFREQEQLLKEVSQRVAQYEQQSVEAQAKAFESEFKQSNPDLANKYDDLTASLREEADKYANQGITGDALEAVLQARWDLMITQARASQPAAPKSVVTKTPKSPSPVKGRGTPVKTSSSYDRSAAIRQLLGG